LIAALQQPGVGLVTTLYAGLPAVNGHGGRHLDRAERGDPDLGRPDLGSPDLDRRALDGAAPPTLPARLGATHITHGFLPGAVLARALGRQDCLGATMCLRRSNLEAIGGFHALVDHLADDNVLGRRIASLGLGVALAGTVALTTVPETSMRALFRHELRWARTIRALEPAGFAASVLQYPLAWALLTILLTGGVLWSVGFFVIAWALRAIAGLCVDRALAPLWTENSGSRQRDVPEPNGYDLAALAFSCPVWLLPLRDVLSVVVMLASYGGREVDWRGHGLHADTPPPATAQPVTLNS
jgi:ceramide glucosyltransferase